MLWIYIGLAGALGAALRLLLSAALQQAPLFALPWGTLLCNWTGCLLLGIAAYHPALAEHPRLRTAVTTGLIGSFTTFSTFSVELLTLLEAGRLPTAALYMLLSAVGGLLLVRSGRTFQFARWKRGFDD
ncbi:fluoride efflux transporter CrcB [Paenibacillus sp. YYML68]|uniref:fluoride efflux transporter CrcB n=1 Tax=Paenibacillus sp. YYML68 TaxID=2909250 RepID=UPI0024906360|nr:fluoride efflux transporter CrcB [Paenibacillus sp. YYML68]